MFLVIRYMLITSIVLLSPTYEGVPVLAHPGLTSGPGCAVAAFWRWEQKVVSSAHGVFAHMVDTVHCMADITGERAAMVCIIEEAMNVFLHGTVSFRALHIGRS